MQTKYKKPDWAVNQVIRDDRGGMVEDICEHGIGHPNLQWLKDHPEDSGVHGCDFCCTLKDIPGLEGRYAITTNGRVWSYSKHGGSKVGMWMKLREGDGYLWIQLRKNGSTIYKSAHRLVAETHIPNPENKRVVNHKDFDRKNNDVSNLEWVTDSENSQYSYDNNRRPEQPEISRKNGYKMRKLTGKDVKNIRILYFSESLTQKEISKMYNVCEGTIYRVVHGITYRRIE